MASRKRKQQQWWLVYRNERPNCTSPWGASTLRVDAVQALTQVEAALFAMDRNPTRAWQWLYVRRAKWFETGTALQTRTERDLQIVELERIIRRMDPARPV